MKITVPVVASLFTLFFLSFSLSHAAHIVGVDLTYRCINPVNQTFEVDITLYRDCAGGGANFDNNITIFAFRSLTGALQTTATAAFPGFSTPVIPPNWAACSNQPYTLCVEVATYSTTITLPPRAGGYDIGWARCCRNNSITNLANPGGQGITVTAHIPGTNEVTGCNNSAVFTQVAPQFLCANQLFSFNHSATDVDGDSLVYSVCNPYTGVNFAGLGAGPGNATVSVGGPGANPMGPPPYNNSAYMAPFSYLDPFLSGNFNIDPQSGLLTVTPPVIGQFVFAICVQEYRNGVLINETKRDFQINVINCINQGQPPVTTNTPPATGTFSNDTLYIDPLDSFCYDVDLAGAIPTDTVALFPVSAIFGIGGSNIPPPLATLTYTTTNPAVGLVEGTVCWASNCDHAGDTIRFIVGGNNISDCSGFNIAYDTLVVVVSGGALPDVTNSIGPNGSSINIDPNTPFCYTFDVTDPDVIDTLKASLAAGPFASTNPPTITYSGIRPITGQVCWTPSCADANTAFQIVIAGKDTNYCPQQHITYDTLNVTVNALPRVDVSPRNASLCVGDTVALRAIVAAPGATAYAWTPNTNITSTNTANTQVFPTTTTTYTVDVTDAFGCSHVRTIPITVDTIPIVTLTPDTFNCPGDSLQLLAGGGGTYVWTPATGLSNPNIGNPLASPNDTTTYTVTVTNSGNCSASDSVTVTTMNIATTMSPVLCPGDSIQLFAAGGVTYSWAPAATLINANTATPTAFPMVTTPYVVTVTDINGCVDTDTVTVTVNPLPIVTISNDTTLCAGDIAPLFATGGVSYSWTPALGLNNANIRTPNATPTTTTRYIVTVTDANTCTNQDSVDITVNALPPVFAGNDTVKCGNIGVPLNATGATTYVWTPIAGLSNPNIANPIANPTATTTYTVTGTDGNGCSSSDQIDVILFDGMIGPDLTICAGDTVQITASGGVSYSWNNGATLSATNIANPLAFPTVTTQYIVDIFHPAGCFDADTIVVNVNPLPIPGISNDTTLCAGDMAPLFATGGTSYSWTPAGSLTNANIANPVATPATTTDYIVTITDANMCSINDTVQVSVNALPTVFAGNDTTKCGNIGVPLNATGAVTYVWSPVTGLSNPNIANPIANPNVTTTYTVTGTDANGCINTDQVNVALFQGTVSPDVTICEEDTTQLTAFGGSSYVWTPAATLSNPNIANPRAFPLVTTQYIVNIFHPTGCFDADTVNVTVIPQPTIITHNDTAICIGDTITIFASGGASYVWTADPTLASTGTASTQVFPTSTTTYYVSVTGANGCSDIDSVTVSVNALPIIDAGNDTAKCGNTGVQLTATGGVSYVWSPPGDLNNPNIASPIANPAVSTTYYVVGTDANQCSNIDSVFVRVMYADAGPDVPVCIFDSVQLMASGGVSYSWTPPATLTNANIANPLAFPVVDTDYIVTVTDVTGCTDMDTVRVTVNPLPVTTVSQPFPYVCSGGATTLTATGGVTYIWDPSPTLSNVNIFNPVATPVNTTGMTVDSTWYWVTVIDANGCRNRDSIGIEVRLLPVITAIGDTNVCPGDSIRLFASGGVSYSWFPSRGLSDPNIANPFAKPDTTLTYGVSVTAVWGCTDTLYAQVYTLYPEAGPDETICLNDSAQLLAVGGTNYVWTPAATLTNPNIANPQAFPSVTTTYTVTITDSLGCVDDDTMVVNVLPLPPTDAGLPDSICFGLNTQLNATGGVSYQWDPEPSLSNLMIANPIATPGITTTYYVTATGANGCSRQDSVEIVVHQLPVADAGPDQAICIGDTTLLTGAGAITFAWVDGATLNDTTLANPMAFPTVTTDYILTVTDIFGCQDDDTVQVVVNPLPNADAGPNTGVCFGLSTILNATGGTTYQWDPHPTLNPLNVANPTATPTDTTTYYVTVTDSNTCVNRDSVTVDVYPLPFVDAGPDTSVCFGLSTQLNAMGGVSYTWLPDPTLSATNIANPVATPIVTTKYYVSVTDFRGCINVDSVEVTVFQLPRADAGPDDAICFGDSAQLNGSGGLQFLWDNGATLSYDTLANPMASPMMTTDYVLTVTDINGCQDTDTMTLTVNPIPNADAGPTAIICENESTQLNATGGVVYVWDPSPFLNNLNVSDPVATPDSTRTFYVTVTDDKGCFARDSVTVLVNLLPPIFAGPDTGICIGENITLQASGGSTYIWDNDATLSALTIANPVAMPTTTTEYFVTGTDAAGCVNRDSVIITVNELPNIMTSPDTTICQGFIAPLRAMGGVSYVWTPAATLDDPNRFNPLASPDSTTIYSVTGTDANGCVNTDDVMIMVIPAPVAEGLDSVAICKFQFITLTVSGGNSYRWSNGSTQASITVGPQTTTNYWVVPYGDNDCPGDTFYMTVYVEENLPRAMFEPGVTEGFYPLEVPMLNLSEFAARYIWRFGDGQTSLEPEPIHTYQAPGLYVITLVADNEIGCPDSVTFEVIDAWDFEIYYPNAFTPNGDSKNDEFFIPSGAMQTLNINIFNRWGELIYASTSPDFRWDGTRNGTQVPEGVYTYVVKATTFAGEVIERSGTITLIR